MLAHNACLHKSDFAVLHKRRLEQLLYLTQDSHEIEIDRLKELDSILGPSSTEGISIIEMLCF